MHLSFGIVEVALIKMRKHQNFQWGSTTLIFLSTHNPTRFGAACGGGTAGAQGTAQGHASPPGGEAAASGGAETVGQGAGAGEGDVLPAADTQPGQRHMAGCDAPMEMV